MTPRGCGEDLKCGLFHTDATVAQTRLTRVGRLSFNGLIPWVCHTFQIARCVLFPYRDWSLWPVHVGADARVC